MVGNSSLHGNEQQALETMDTKKIRKNELRYAFRGVTTPTLAQWVLQS